MYKAEWLYTVAVKCYTTIVQRRSGECKKCRDTYMLYVLQWVSCSVVRRRGGRNCFCVWRFWRTVICRVYQGRSLKSLCPGCEGSAVIFPARFLTLEVYRSWMVGRLAPMIFSADLTVRWSLFLSSLVADPNQTMSEVPSTDSLTRV